jgi:hypothetical protein
MRPYKAHIMGDPTAVLPPLVKSDVCVCVCVCVCVRMCVHTQETQTDTNRHKEAYTFRPMPFQGLSWYLTKRGDFTRLTQYFTHPNTPKRQEAGTWTIDQPRRNLFLCK